MSTTGGSRRRTRAEMTAAIEEAAVDLVLEHGYDSLTVDMICDRVGISQRTFFNYFATKDAAFVGTDTPHIDQRKAREFVLSRGPLLSEAIGLVDLNPDVMPPVGRLFVARMRAIAANPALLAYQIDRLAVLEDEIREIIRLRLARDWPLDAEEQELDRQAALITHILAGVFRYLSLTAATAIDRGERLPEQTDIAALVDATLRQLVGTTSDAPQAAEPSDASE